MRRRLGRSSGVWAGVSLALLAPLPGSACGHTDSTIGIHETRSGGECDRPGGTRNLDDCTTCTCGTDRQWSCTSTACDAGPAGSGDSGGECSLACSMPEVTWRTQGGFPVDRSVLSCARYFHERTSSLNLSVMPSCSIALGCRDQSAVSGVQAALADPELAQAFLDPPGMYGARRAGGPVLVIEVQGRQITAAQDCDGTTPECQAVPRSLRALFEALVLADAHFSERAECASTFDSRQCETNAECPAEFYCWRDGFCAGTGFCSPRPRDCESAAEAGGCSCDGVFYGKACDAHADGRLVEPGSSCGARCSPPDLTVRGNCGISFGWAYAALSGSSPCVELRGCDCFDAQGAPCADGARRYGSRQACERAHADCDARDE
jgi:hypothetical protein